MWKYLFVFSLTLFAGSAFATINPVMNLLNDYFDKKQNSCREVEVNSLISDENINTTVEDIAEVVEEVDPLANDKIENINNYQRLKKIARETYHANISPTIHDQGFKACRKKLFDEYSSERSLWGSFTKDQRKIRIGNHTKRTFDLLQTSTKPVNNRIKPHMLSCIAYIEAETTLSPHTFNETVCLRRFSSSANGLANVTRTTFKDLKLRKRLPLTTVSLASGLSDDEVFERSNADVPLQIEIGYRVLSEKFRLAERAANRAGGKTDKEIELDGIQRYDRDNNSKYMEKYRKCSSCFERFGDLTEESSVRCYNEMVL